MGAGKGERIRIFIWKSRNAYSMIHLSGKVKYHFHTIVKLKKRTVCS